MKRLVYLLLSSTGFFFTSSLLADTPLSITFEGSYNTGSLSGYSQTPKGGNVSTTTLKRPTFDELGVHHDDFFDFKLHAEKNTWGIYLGYRDVTPSGNGVTTDFLITHNQTIPGSTPLSGNITYEWYALGLTKTFEYCNWLLTPEISGNFIKYRYQFSAPLTGSIRAFGLGNIGIGLNAQYYLTQKLSAHFIAKASVPLFNLTHYEGAFRLSYKVLEKNGMSLIPFVGISTLYIDGEDSQTMPNHIRYENRPFGTIGFKIVY